MRSPTLSAELQALEQRKSTLEKDLATEPPPPVRLHPNLAEVYRQKIQNLRDALNQDDSRMFRHFAALILRSPT